MFEGAICLPASLFNLVWIVVFWLARSPYCHNWSWRCCSFCFCFFCDCCCCWCCCCWCWRWCWRCCCWLCLYPTMRSTLTDEHKRMPKNSNDHHMLHHNRSNSLPRSLAVAFLAGLCGWTAHQSYLEVDGHGSQLCTGFGGKGQGIAGGQASGNSPVSRERVITERVGIDKPMNRAQMNSCTDFWGDCVIWEGIKHGLEMMEAYYIGGSVASLIAMASVSSLPVYHLPSPTQLEQPAQLQPVVAVGQWPLRLFTSQRHDQTSPAVGFCWLVNIDQ